ncbi:MAG: sigma-54 factor interaction region [Spirochaetes bacterium]|nr:MAG: sigma-54 factor interaction region [Spirochaetota bacterium]
MFEPKIVALLPNHHLMDNLQAVQEKMGVDFPKYHKQVQEALVLARKSVQEGAKVIISRGLTAEYLRKFLDVPVVEIEYDFFQFAEAMRRALRFSDAVAVIGFIDAYRLAEQAVEYVRREGQDIRVRILETSAQIEDTVRDLGEEGFRVFVGGNTVVRNARALGYEGVYVEPNEKVIQAAIEKAQYELRIYLDREEKFKTIQAIVNCAANGIFAVDGTGAVTEANPMARKHLLAASPGTAYPASIKDIMPGSKLLATIKSG